MVELLRTKLYIPRPRKDLVFRPRLIDRLNAGLEKKLALISAPAGFGKTTLLSEWISKSPRCVTWLSLDEGDNEPTQFWTYFIASLQGLHPDLGASPLALIQSPQAPPIKSILAELINDLIDFSNPFASVLDDYHFIDSQPIHEALTFLIDHLPANLHLVITTREDPALPLARLRARDQLTEIRAMDLRFTQGEAGTFLRGAMGLALSEQDVAVLEGRTEGWAVGLQLAGLSMQGQADPKPFIADFSGSHRYILDYLTDEVLQQQPENILSFLLHTAILDRLSAPLCDALTERNDSDKVLVKLEADNLFVSPLDEERGWYRYHHLFAEVLRARLRQSQPDLLVELHERASEWFEAQDLHAEAIQHSLAAGNVVRAANLIERERWTLLGRGEANTLHSWLDALPVEIVSDRPALSLAYAWISTILRQAEAIEPRLQAAEKILEAHAPKSSNQPVQIDDAIRGEITTLRAEIALNQNDNPRAIELCQTALNLLPEDNPLMLAFANYFLGHGKRRSGHTADAERAYYEASSLGLRANNLLIALHSLANLSGVQIMMGHLRDAADTSQRILQITAERQGHAWPVAGLACYGLSKLYYEWNDLDSALRYSRLGIESGQGGGLIGLELNSRNVLAFTLQAQHDPSGADRALQHNAAISERHRHPLHAAETAALQARLKLRQGCKEEAFRWAETCGLRSEDTLFPFSHEMEYLTLARVLIAQGQLGAALELLVRLLQTAESDQRNRSVIEILTLQSLARHKQGDMPGAMDALEYALSLAESQGYVRTFVDEGEPLQALLDELKFRLKDEALIAYANRLLEAMLCEPASPETGEEHAELLSERELEVLRYLSKGQTYEEISQQLFLSLSTVQFHIKNIYGKLLVNKRVQAIEKARELKLI